MAEEKRVNDTPRARAQAVYDAMNGIATDNRGYSMWCAVNEHVYCPGHWEYYPDRICGCTCHEKESE